MMDVEITWTCSAHGGDPTYIQNLTLKRLPPYVTCNRLLTAVFSVRTNRSEAQTQKSKCDPGNATDSLV